MKGRRELPCRQIGDELVVRDPDSGRVFFLNETAADVWRVARDLPDAGQITRAMCARYDNASEAQIRADVERCLDELAHLRLIEVGSSDRGRS